MFTLSRYEGLNNSPQCSSQQKCTKRDTEKIQLLHSCLVGCSTRNEIHNCISIKKNRAKEKESRYLIRYQDGK